MPRSPQRILPFRPSANDASLPLATLHDLGPKSSAWHTEAAITTRAELERIGPIDACRRTEFAKMKRSTANAARSEWKQFARPPDRDLTARKSRCD